MTFTKVLFETALKQGIPRPIVDEMVKASPMSRLPARDGRGDS